MPSQRSNCGHFCVQGAGSSVFNKYGPSASSKSVPTESIRVYSASWWRCTPKVVPFLPQLALHGDEWAQLVDSVCPRFGVSPADIILLFKLLCRGSDFPDVVVRLRQSFYALFDKMTGRVLRLLALHASKSGLWTPVGGSRVDPAKQAYRHVVEFSVFLPWLLEVASLDVYTLIARIVRGVFCDWDRVDDTGTPYPPVIESRRAAGLLKYLTAYGPSTGVRIGPSTHDEFVSMCLRGFCSFSALHSQEAFVDYLVRYPVFAHPVMMTQWAVQRKFLGVSFWRDKAAADDDTTGVRDGSQQRHRFPIPLDLSLRYCRVVTARTLLLEAGSVYSRPLQFGSAYTMVMPPKEESSSVVPDLAMAAISDLATGVISRSGSRRSGRSDEGASKLQASKSEELAAKKERRQRRKKKRRRARRGSVDDDRGGGDAGDRAESDGGDPRVRGRGTRGQPEGEGSPGKRVRRATRKVTTDQRAFYDDGDSDELGHVMDGVHWEVRERHYRQCECIALLLGSSTQHPTCVRPGGPCTKPRACSWL
jgi:hypothetical protein